MADSTSAPVLSPIATVNSKLSELSVKDGQVIFVQDKNVIAMDFGGKIRFYKQIEEISTEEARTSMLAPVTGHYYFVIETGVMWTYQDAWVQITTTPEDIKNYADGIADNAATDATSKANAALESSKAYADEIGQRITGSIDNNGNLIITISDALFTAE